MNRIITEKSFRILVDLHPLGLKYVWMSVSPLELKTIKDLKDAIIKKFLFDKSEIELYLQDGLLPDDENVFILRENDVVRIQFAEVLHSYCSNSNVSELSVCGKSISEETGESSCCKRANRQIRNSTLNPNISRESNQIKSSKKKKRKLENESPPNNDSVIVKNIKSAQPTGVIPETENIKIVETHEPKNKRHKSHKKKRSHSDNESFSQNNSFTTPNKKTNFSDIVQKHEVHVSLKGNKGVETNENAHDAMSDYCNISNAAACSSSLLISDQNVNRNESVLTVEDAEQDVQKKVAVHSNKNNSTDSNNECVIVYDSPILQGNNCKKKKRKRRKKRKVVPSDFIANESENFNSSCLLTGETGTVAVCNRDSLNDVTLALGCNLDLMPEVIRFPQEPLETSVSFSEHNNIEDETNSCKVPKTAVHNNSELNMCKQLGQDSSNKLAKPTYKHVKYIGDWKCEDLDSFPSEGTRIAYKMLELDESYSPVVCNYKEGIVKKANPATDELEIELTHPDVIQRKTGKFENIYSSDDVNASCEIVNQVKLNWSALINPVKIIEKSSEY